MSHTAEHCALEAIARRYNDYPVRSTRVRGVKPLFRSLLYLSIRWHLRAAIK